MFLSPEEEEYVVYLWTCSNVGHSSQQTLRAYMLKCVDQVTCWSDQQTWGCHYTFAKSYPVSECDTHSLLRKSIACQVGKRVFRHEVNG